MHPALGLLVLAGVLFGLGSAQGWALLHALSFAVAIAVAGSYLWARASIQGLYIRPRPLSLRAQVGAAIEERFEVENLSWLPRPWLEFDDCGDHPQHNLSQVISLGPHERRVRPVRTLLRQRGEFQLGPLNVAGGDPFGLFSRRRQMLPASRLIVFPSTELLPFGGRIPGDLSGGATRGERVLFMTPNVATIREYHPGDARNRVHWPSTARTGRLMVKESERDPFSDVTLLLDLDRLVQVGSGLESTEEVAVGTAATLARHFLEADRSLRIVVQGDEVPADRGPMHVMRVLEFLALVRSRRGQPIGELLLAVAPRFSRRDAIVVITPSTDAAFVGAARLLTQRGVSTSVVLVRGSDYGPAPDYEPVISAVSSAGLTGYLVSRARPLVISLTQPFSGFP